MDPLVIVGQRNPFLETKNVPGKKNGFAHTQRTYPNNMTYLSPEDE
jgi:hypothetical protein